MAFWDLFKRKHQSGPEPRAKEPVRFRITEIRVDPDVCTCSQICVDECPEVLDGDTESGVPRVREGAEVFFTSKAAQIQSACDVCPVDAIRLKKEPL